MIRKATMAVAAVSIAALIAGCGTSPTSPPPNPEAGMKPTMTQQQATQHVDDYMKQILGVLPPAQLEDLEEEPMACDDPTDHGPKGRVFVGRGYMLHGLPKEDNARNIDKVRQWALTHNFGILDDVKQPDQFLSMENKQDGFRVSISESGDESKVMSLDVGSPCVWPNGTPAPKPQGQAEPDTPDSSTPQAVEPAQSNRDFGPFDPARFASRRDD